MKWMTAFLAAAGLAGSVVWRRGFAARTARAGTARHWFDSGFLACRSLRAGAPAAAFGGNEVAGKGMARI